MTRYIIIIILLLGCLHVSGQMVDGKVVDDEGGSAIAGVSAYSKKTGFAVQTDVNGRFSISAVAGETLVFTHMSYGTSVRVVPYSKDELPMTVVLVPMTRQLDKVVISGRTKYQRDSAEKHEMYGHELARPLVPKPKYTGLGCAGCFGWLADKITGNSKKPKRFKKHFAADDEQLFIDSRYNNDLVLLLTGMSEPDSAASFIFRYPMEYEFARAASDLELKAWVRYNYREYKQDTMR